jgi:hypothetical protein
MNIYNIRDNLKNTIAGKEKMLADYQEARRLWPGGEDAALFATQEFLKVNIDELRRILQDVEKCCEKATADSWRENPDRMGGQFTQDEIDNHGRWI